MPKQYLLVIGISVFVVYSIFFLIMGIEYSNQCEDVNQCVTFMEFLWQTFM